MIVVYILLILLLVILFTPFGIHGRYGDESYLLAARVLFFDIKLISSDDEEDDKKTKKRTPPKKRETAAEKEPDKAIASDAEKKAEDDKKQNEELSEEANKTENKPKRKLAFEVNEIIDLVFLALDTLGKFKQKLMVNKFKFHFISASNDPYETVIYFNLAGVILEALKGFSKKSCTLCSVDIKTGMDFEANEPIVDIDIIITINLIRILTVLIAAGFGFLKIRKAYKNNKNNEGTINYGSTN